MAKTNYDAIKQMSIEELAFFLAVVEMDNPNSIPNIDKENLDYFIEYLNKDSEGLSTLCRMYVEKICNKYTKEVKNDQ